MSEQSSSAAVEELLSRIRALAAEPDRTPRFDLWVPATLTLRGAPVSADIAMAILVDQILAVGYMPDGFTSATGGRRYHYVLGSDARRG